MSPFVRDDMGEARKIYDLDQCGCIRLWNAVCLNWPLLSQFCCGPIFEPEKERLYPTRKITQSGETLKNGTISPNFSSPF